MGRSAPPQDALPLHTHLSTIISNPKDMKKTYQKPQMQCIELGDILTPICTSPGEMQVNSNEATYDCFSVNKGGNSWVKVSDDAEDDED